MSQMLDRLNQVSTEFPDLDIRNSVTELLRIYQDGDRQRIMRLLETIRAHLEDHPIVAEFERLPLLTVAKTRAPGSLPNVPWISILDNQITNSTRSGIYCVYLFKSDMSGLYLTYNQGAGISVERGTAGVDVPLLRSQAQLVRSSLTWMKDYEFSLDDAIDLGEGGPARSYKAGCIAYKYYPLESIPSNAVFAQDLAVALEGYAQTGRKFWSIFNMKTITSTDRHAEFVDLFQQFIDEYPFTRIGAEHIRAYPEQMVTARQGLDEVIEAKERGQDVTDLVLHKLLPHNDTEPHREVGAWVCIAPAIVGDVRKWFDSAGWTKHEDWPQVSEAILRFVSQCVDDPTKLKSACGEFDNSGCSKGFQCGMLTPILSALSPGNFILANNKSIKVLNYFAEADYSSQIADYPETNAATKALIGALNNDIENLSDLELANYHVFDMFCHWLVSVRKFPFAGTGYWKIAPGENARFWDQCRNNGYIGIGWDKLEDLTGLNREEFYAAYDEVSTTDSTYTKSGAGQVWKFMNIQEGDRIVANRGTSTVVGIGTVTGPYYHALDVLHDDDHYALSHRMPVDWDDITPRMVDQPGWRRTLIKLDHEAFKGISEAPQDTHSLAHPFSKIFSSRDEAERALDIYAILLEGLGVFLPSQNEKVVLVPTGIYGSGGKLNLTYYNWLLLSFSRRKKTGLRVILTLRDNLASALDLDAAAQPFHNGGKDDLPSCSLYNVEFDKLDPISDELRRAIVETMSVVLERFQDYGNSPLIKFHRAELVTAALDTEYRDILLTDGLTQPPTPTQQAWIFQGNPDFFDIDTYLQSDDPCYWSVKHKKHQDSMSIGDPVWFWRAKGKKTRAVNGIIARGTIGELPKKVDVPKEEHLWSEGEERRSEILVKVLIDPEEVRLSPQTGMITEDATSNDPVLSEMGIIRTRIGTNFPIEPEEHEWIETMWNENRKPPQLQPGYTLEQIEEDTHIDRSQLERWKAAIMRKRQAVFYGPPGTGKTFVARLMAKHLVGGTDGILELVQFHPAYAYEDFMQGIRPHADEEGRLSYPLEAGRFLQFCEKAAQSSGGPCVLVVDEINRANLARVFGELMYLLEYRDDEVPLAGGGMFKIPDNVLIIGTMNTADRSIALVDHALRRRFAFLQLYPNYDILERFHQKRNTQFSTRSLRELLERLNRDIADPHYEVGVSFFLTESLGQDLEDIWRMEIEPYLEEYFFDQADRLASYRWDEVREGLEQ